MVAAARINFYLNSRYILRLNYLLSNNFNKLIIQFAKNQLYLAYKVPCVSHHNVSFFVVYGNSILDGFPGSFDFPKVIDIFFAYCYSFNLVFLFFELVEFPYQLFAYLSAKEIFQDRRSIITISDI